MDCALKVVSRVGMKKGKSESEFVAERVAASVTACSGCSGACLMILAAD